MPDATGLELLAQDLREAHGEDAVTGTVFFREQATIEIAPAAVRDAVTFVRDRGYRFLSSVHGVDYYPDEPRLGIHYHLIDMDKVDRIGLKVRVPIDAAEIDSVVDMFPGADHQEREVYDLFGVVFRGHPNLRRILMPEDYEGHPLRRDFPVGGEPVMFTHNVGDMDYIE